MHFVSQGRSARELRTRPEKGSDERDLCVAKNKKSALEENYEKVDAASVRLRKMAVTGTRVEEEASTAAPFVITRHQPLIVRIHLSPIVTTTPHQVLVYI